MVDLESHCFPPATILSEGGATRGLVSPFLVTLVLSSCSSSATVWVSYMSLAGSSDQEHTVDLPGSFLSVYKSYHLEDLGVFTNWSLNSPAVSAFLDGYLFAMATFNFSSFLHSQSSASNLMDTCPLGWDQEPAKGLSSSEEGELSKSGIWCQPIKECTPLIVSL